MSTITHSHPTGEVPPTRVARIASGHGPHAVAYLLTVDLQPGACTGFGGADHPADVAVVTADERLDTCWGHLAWRLAAIERNGGRNVEVHRPAPPDGVEPFPLVLCHQAVEAPPADDDEAWAALPVAALPFGYSAWCRRCGSGMGLRASLGAARDADTDGCRYCHLPRLRARVRGDVQR